MLEEVPLRIERMSRDPLWMRIWIAESRWERKLVKERPFLASILVMVPVVTFAVALRSDGPIGYAVRAASCVLGAVLLLLIGALSLRGRTDRKRWLDDYVAAQVIDTKARNQSMLPPNDQQ